MKRLAGALAALWLTLPGLAGAAPSAADQAAIGVMETRLTSTGTKTLAQRMAELNVPGVSVAFIEDGKVKWTRAYGVAEAGTTRMVTPDTLFQAASMSKAVAAAAALRLVDQGKLALDEDVNLRLKGWKVPPSAYTAERKVTLRALLSHSAGMTVSGFPGYPAGRPVPDTVQILAGAPPANTPAVVSWEAPGKYAYSGGGYTVAQLLITEAGSKPYPELVGGLVLKPLRMRRSTFAQPLPASLLPRAAAGHGVRGLVIAGARNTYPEYAAAGLWTTPSDYGRFFIGLQDAWAGKRGALISQAGARAMTTAVDPDVGYGLGLQLGTRGGRPYIQHGGSNAGFQCGSMAFLDGSRQGVVVMTNAEAGGVLGNDIVVALAKAYGWPEQDRTNKPSPRRAPLATPKAAAYQSRSAIRPA